MSDATSSYFLLRFSVSPKRYALIKNNEKICLFGTKTLRMFFPDILPALFDTEKGKVVSLALQEFQQLVQEEDKFLCNDMFGYLAQEEKSPLELKVWLMRRGLRSDQCAAYVQIATEKNFLNPLRFAALYVQKRALSPWPWGLTRGQLLHHGVPAESVDSFAYNDREALSRKYSSFKFNNPQKQKIQLRTKLIGRGFSVDIVKNLLENLSQEKAESQEFLYSNVQKSQRIRLGNEEQSIQQNGDALKNKDTVENIKTSLDEILSKTVRQGTEKKIKKFKYKKKEI